MTRLELYNLVWSTPTSTVQDSRLLGRRDCQVCRKHKIPVPPAPAMGEEGSRANAAANSIARSVRQLDHRIAGAQHEPACSTGTNEGNRPQIKVADLRGCHNLITLANEELQAQIRTIMASWSFQRSGFLTFGSRREVFVTLVIFDAILKTCEGIELPR